VDDIEALQCFGGKTRLTHNFQQLMESEEAADAMKFDGARRETILTLVEP